MDVSWFACRVCGCGTFGIDSYVVCDGCVREYEQRPRLESEEHDEVAHAPITAEVEARLRKMLDW